MKTVLVAIAILASSGCDRQPPPYREHPGEREQLPSPESVARALGQDAAALTSPVDPPPKAGDLKADLEHFTTVDACVAARAELDPVVGDALLSVGYDTFLRDACRVLEAAKAKDARRCTPIEASSLRAHCESMVAMVAENPEACPLDIDGDATRGHDPTCIAVASRDARLCAGEAESRRSTCEAMLLGDDKKCAGEARRQCARSVARWKTVLASGGDTKRPPPLPAPKGTLTIHGTSGTSDPPETSADLAIEVSRGVVLTRELGGARLRVGSLQELGVVPHASNPVARPRIGFELVVLHDAPSEAKIDHLELEIPGELTVVVPSMRASLTATVAKLDKTRAGEVQLVVEGTVGTAGRAYAVRAEITTFVRDVVGFGKR